MKSRIKTSEPKLIVYGFNGVICDKISAVCEGFGIEMIACDCAEMKLSDILKAENSCRVEDTENQCIVMCGFTESLLDKFLSELRQNKIIIPLKAILTPYNKSMTIEELVKELKLEHKKLNSSR